MTARILVVDNYDSFVYNLVQYVGEFADEVVVRRNDAIDLEGIDDLDVDGIVVSPGPGAPVDAGVSIPVFRDREYPTLGVCLGHQALCAAEGATVEHAPAVVHGKPSTVRHDGEGIYRGVQSPFEAGRYHSLAVAEGEIPACLAVTARTPDDVVMSVRHRSRPHVGVQYHPESVLTDAGKTLVENFVASCTDRTRITENLHEV